jgi:asparagine synthase (glutamine-hydrolysing)
MCGINGIYNYSDLSSSLENVKLMNEVSVHRGPDFSGFYNDNKVIFGHNRLSIIDLAKEANQPFVSSDGNVVLVFNGEIYNFNELKEQLRPNYKFITSSDTEVLLAAYLKWGNTFVSKLNGMFAFALWDKTKDQFILGRDRLGIKPLYYIEANQSVYFSSSINSLMQNKELSLAVDSDSIKDYLQYGTVHSPETLVSPIKMLPKSSILIVSEDEWKVDRYYDLINESKNYTTNFKYEDVKQNIRKLVCASVKKRLNSDVPFGVFLSGGIDSSILVAAAAKESKKPINTFSVVFEEEAFNEAKYSQLVAKKYKTNHTEIKLTAKDLLNELESSLSLMDHPSIDGLNTYVICKAAKKQGLTMALSGLGADELFAGYPVFKQSLSLESKKWLYSFPPIIRRIFSSLLITFKPSVQNQKIAGILNQKLFELPYYYPFFRQIFTDNQISKLINSSPKYNYPNDWGITHLEPGNNGYDLPFLSKISVLELETYLQNVLLRDVDQMSMANSMEIRVPFLDHDLVSYVLSLGDAYKHSNYPKKLLVDSFEDWLPKEIIFRKKMGFVLPWENWMKKELKDFSHDGLMGLVSLKVFNMKEVKKLWNAFLLGDKLVPWYKIWSLVILGKWMSNNKQYVLQ